METAVFSLNTPDNARHRADHDVITSVRTIVNKYRYVLIRPSNEHNFIYFLRYSLPSCPPYFPKTRPYASLPPEAPDPSADANKQ